MPASPASDTSFLKHYEQARSIAAQNTLVRLIFSAFNDKFFEPGELAFTVAEAQSGKNISITDQPTALDYLFSREPDQQLSITLSRGDEVRVIEDPSELWELMKPYAQKWLEDAFDEEGWQSAKYAMLESLNKEALSVARRIEIKEQLNEKTHGSPTTWAWLASQHAPDSDELRTFLYQAGSFTGYQQNPLSKLRRHLTNGRAIGEDKQLRYFAEHGNHFPLPVMAVSKAAMQVYQNTDNKDFTVFFKDTYASTYEQWRQHLADLGKSPDNFYPIPVHPLNQKAMQSHLAQWIESGDIIETPATVDVYPNISTRTVRPRDEESKNPHHIKTSLPDIQITGGPRNVPRFEAQNAPVLTKMIKDIVAENDGFGATLGIVGEPYGFFFSAPGMEKDKQDKLGQYLSGFFRENPQSLVRKDEYLLPVAAVFSNVGKDENGNNTTLLADMMRTSGVTNAEQAKAYFRDYAHTVLKGQLGLFARYGVALEAHQQNTYLAFGKEGRLRSTVVQDIVSNTYVYEPVLKSNAAFASLPLETSKHLEFVPNLLEPVQQLFHTVLKSHLIAAIAVTCREFGTGKGEMMNILKEEIHNTLAAAKDEHLPKLAEGQRDTYIAHVDAIESALLNEPTWDKAVLTMLLTHSYGRIGVEQPNAFARQYS